MFEEGEISEEFIRNYLQGQLNYYAEPFVEKKAKQEQHNDIQGEISINVDEFNEILGEISRDEQQIKVLIELCAFLLDKNLQSNMKQEEDQMAYEEHISQLQEKIDFEKRTARQFQIMYQDQHTKNQESIQVIANIEQQLFERDNTVMMLEQSQKSNMVRKPSLGQDQIAQSNVIIDDLRAQITKMKQENQKLKDKVEYFQQTYQKQSTELEDMINDNQVLKLDKVKQESKIKLLENEINRLNQQIQDLEQQITLYNDSITGLKRQIFELQNMSANKDSQLMMSQQGSQFNSMIAPNKHMRFDLPDQSITNNRPSNFKHTAYEQEPINELPAEEQQSSRQHSKQVSEVPSNYTFDMAKLQEKLNKLGTPSQTPRQLTTPRSQLPRSVLDVNNSRANKIIEKLKGSAQNSPRTFYDGQPLTNRQEFKISPIQEDQEDYEYYGDEGYIDQKVLTPAPKIQIKLPPLALNSSSSQPKSIYNQFSQANQEFFQENKVDKVFTQPFVRSVRQSMIGQKSILFGKRNQYEEFFELVTININKLTQCVKLNSPYLDEIYAIDTRDYYQIAQKENLPFNKWEEWIQERLYAQAKIAYFNE